MVMIADFSPEYIKGLCKQSTLSNLGYEDLLQVYQVVSSDESFMTANPDIFNRVVWAFETSVKADIKNKSFKPRNLEGVRNFFGEKGQLEIDGTTVSVKEVLDDQAREAVKLRRLAINYRNTDDDYIANTSVNSMAEDYALFNYARSHLDEYKNNAEFAAHQDQLVNALEAKYKRELIAAITSYSDLDATRYLAKANQELGAVIEKEDLLEKATTFLDQENNIPQVSVDNSDAINQNATFFNRNLIAFNNQKLLGNQEFADLWNAVELTDNPEVELPAATKDDYLSSLLEGAKSAVLRDQLANVDFAALSADDKNARLQELINRQVMEDMFTAIMATSFNDAAAKALNLPQPTAEEKKPGTPAQKAYNDKVLAAFKAQVGNNATAQDYLKFINDNYNSGNQKIQINKLQLLAGHADKDVTLEEYNHRLREKFLEFDAGRQAKTFEHEALVVAEERRESLNKRGNKLFGWAYRTAVAVRKFAADNPGKSSEILGTLGIIGGSIALTTGFVPVVAGTYIAGAMVLHSAAKTFGFPVSDQWKRLAQNDPSFKKLNFIQKYSRAFQAAKESDPDVNAGVNIAVAAGITAAVAGSLIGPLGTRASVGLAVGLGNTIKSWWQVRRLKKLYNNETDPAKKAKYAEQLNGLSNTELQKKIEKESEGKNGLGKIWVKTKVHGLDFFNSKKKVAWLSTGGTVLSGAFFGVKLAGDGYDINHLAQHTQLDSNAQAPKMQTLNTDAARADVQEYRSYSVKTQNLQETQSLQEISNLQETQSLQNFTLPDDSETLKYISQLNREELENLYKDLLIAAQGLPETPFAVQLQEMDSFNEFSEKLDSLTAYDRLHGNVVTNDAVRMALHNEMQASLNNFVTDPEFEAMKPFLPQETLENLANRNPYYLRDLINSGEVKSVAEINYEVLQEKVAQFKEDLVEIGALKEETLSVLEEKIAILAKNEDFQKWVAGMTDEERAPIMDLLKAGKLAEFDRILTAQGFESNLSDVKIPVVDANGNLVDTPLSQLPGDLAPSAGSADMMETYQTRTDAFYQKVLQHQNSRADFVDYSSETPLTQAQTPQGYLREAMNRIEEGKLMGKPSGMTAEDYTFHRQMLREYIGIRSEKDVTFSLRQAGISREDWNNVLAGQADAAVINKVFHTRLGAYAGRLLIDRDVTGCDGTLNAQQIETVHRALSLVNTDPTNAFANGKAGYLLGYGMVPEQDNLIRSVGRHIHVMVDCNQNQTVIIHNAQAGVAKIITQTAETPAEPAPVYQPAPVVDTVPVEAKALPWNFNEFQPNQYIPQVSGDEQFHFLGFKAWRGTDVVLRPGKADYVAFDPEGKIRVDFDKIKEKSDLGKKVYLFAEAERDANNNPVYGEPVAYNVNKYVNYEMIPGNGAAPVDTKFTDSQIASFIEKNPGAGLNKVAVSADGKTFTLLKEDCVVQSVVDDKNNVTTRITDLDGKPTTTIPVETQQSYVKELQDNISAQTPPKVVENVSAPAIDPNEMVGDRTRAQWIEYYQKETGWQKGKMFERILDDGAGKEYTVYTEQGFAGRQYDADGKFVANVAYTLNGDPIDQPDTGSDVFKLLDKQISQHQLVDLQSKLGLAPNEIDIRANAQNLTETHVRLLTDEGVFTEVRNTNTGEVLRVEAKDLSGRPIPEAVLRSDNAPESYKFMHKATDVSMKNRLGTSFKGGYSASEATDNGPVAQNTAKTVDPTIVKAAKVKLSRA